MANKNILNTHTRKIRRLQNKKSSGGGSGGTGPQGPAGQGVPAGGTTGQILAKVDNVDYNTEWTTGGGGGGASDFTDLGDVPSSYSGEGEKLVAVNSAEDALEFINAPVDNVVFTGLTDTPSAYTGQGEKLVAVNSAEDALEFIDAPSGAPPFSGAVVTNSTNTTNITSGVILAWNTTEEDIGGWHSEVTNNSRLTVPTGVTRVLVRCQINMTAVSNADELFISLNKNGASTNIDPRVRMVKDFTTAGYTNRAMYLSSYSIPVTAGDYFELEAFYSGSTADDIQAADTWFAIEAVAGLAADKQILHVRDEKSTTTNGGASTNTTTSTRTLNTVVSNSITGSSLSSNQITLPAGTYRIDAAAPAYRPSRHRALLYNVTDTATEILGKSYFSSNASDASVTDALVRGVFTIAAEKDFEIRQYFQVGHVNGFGVAVSDGNTEIYTDVMIERIA